MSNFIEKTAKTTQEAIDEALLELNTNIDNVNVDIIDEGNKGIFGLIGNKMAKVRVSLKESKGDRAKHFLYSVFDKLHVDSEVELNEDDESIYMKISGKDIGIVIGRRGETLDSLQYLTSLVVNKGEEKYKRVVLDIENYRQKREETLEKLADRLAEKVIRYKKEVVLEPMNPYERRIIHSYLQNHRVVKTYSTGEEPNRKVVISLK